MRKMASGFLQTSDASSLIQRCSPGLQNSRNGGGKRTERMLIGEYRKKATILPNLSKEREDYSIIISATIDNLYNTA